MTMPHSVIFLTIICAFPGGYAIQYPNFLEFTSTPELPENGKESWKGDIPDFPSELKIDERILENLRIQIKHELEQNENGFNFEGYHNEGEYEDFEDLNWDEDIEELPIGEFSNTSATTKTWQRQFAVTKILKFSKYGAKSFLKEKSSSKAEGSGELSISGTLDSTLKVKNSGEGNFDLNMTISKKGHDSSKSLNGNVNSEYFSSTKSTKHRMSSESCVSSDVSIKNYTNEDSITISTQMDSKSETLKAPFRTWLSLFGTFINSTTKIGKNIYTSDSTLKGEVTSHLVYCKNGTSLTRVKVRGFITTKTSIGYKQLALITSKIHIWTKMNSTSENGAAVVDVYTSTKTRTYAKGFGLHECVFSGTGAFACEKSQITISLEDGEKLQESQSGMYVVQNGLSPNGFILSSLLSSVKI